MAPSPPIAGFCQHIPQSAIAVRQRGVALNLLNRLASRTRRQLARRTSASMSPADASNCWKAGAHVCEERRQDYWWQASWE
jgi:hypothetical protein